MRSFGARATLHSAPRAPSILSTGCEELGLISRKEYPVAPPKTEYKLTLGRTLEPVMAAMADWGTSHRAKIVDAAENARRERSQ